MTTVTYPCYIQRKDSRGEWRWTYYAKNGEAISVSSEGYKNRSDCSHAVDIMKGSGDSPLFFYE